MAICGVVGLVGRPWAPREIQPVIDSLGRGRGQVWSGETGRCGVAVASAGRSATEVSPDGSLIAVIDGRLGNFRQLVAELGLRTQDCGPSRLVINGYTKWGASGLLDRLQGEFALALVDRSRGGVLLARDHLGTRPLVVAERKGLIAFASHALALTRVPEIGHDLDETYAAELLFLAYASTRTIVQGVRWLDPGEAMWISAAASRRWHWWRPPAIHEGSIDEHADALTDAFDHAVERCLDGPGPYGVLMSGGLDSTSVAATAASRLSPQRLTTFTAVPPPGWAGPALAGFDLRDGPLAAELASAYPNIEPRYVDVAGRSLFSEYERLWELGGGVPRNPCNSVWLYAIAEAASAAGLPVLLTGAVGNLAFSTDGPGWLWSLLRAGRLRQLSAETRAWAARTGTSYPLVLRRHVVPPLIPPWVRRIKLRLRPGSWDEERSQLTALRPEAASALDLVSLYPYLDRSRLVPLREMFLAVVHDFSHQADTDAAVDALYSVERRDPTGDRRVWEVALAQPEHVRRHNGVSRAVVRRAMAARLPQSVVSRQTTGLQFPDWLDRMTESRREIRCEIEAMRADDVCRRLIDIDLLDRLEKDWPHPSSCADDPVTRRYRSALLRSVVVAKYSRWFRQRTPPTPGASALIVPSAATD